MNKELTATGRSGLTLYSGKVTKPMATEMSGLTLYSGKVTKPMATRMSGLAFGSGKVTEPVATKMSALTLGSGKVIHQDDIDRLELHLNTNDYSNLITQRLRPTDGFSVIRHRQPSFTGTHTTLPKTFVTRSGSLFLYSDSKVMRDNAEQFPGCVASEPFCVQGAKMASSSGQEKASVWKKHVSARQVNTKLKKVPLGSEEKRDKKRYIRGLNRSAKERPKRKPYSWNYAITPVKVSHANQEVSIETVKGLSQALLGYRFKQVTDRTRYENTVLNGSCGSLDSTRARFDKRNPKRNISAWTFAWMRSGTNVRTVAGRSTDDIESVPKFPYETLQKARTDLTLATKGRVPTNTPFTANDRKGLGTGGQSGLSMSPIFVKPDRGEPESFTVYSELSDCESKEGTTSPVSDIV